MTIFCLELRSTQNWDDVRYRAYTGSVSKADRFRSVPRINFTDSGHGIVPVVSEGRQGRLISVLADHVAAHMPAIARAKNRRLSVSPSELSVELAMTAYTSTASNDMRDMMRAALIAAAEAERC